MNNVLFCIHVLIIKVVKIYHLQVVSMATLETVRMLKRDPAPRVQRLGSRKNYV